MSRRRQKRCDLTSSLKMLGTEDVWQPRMGAPLGNCNRLKHGDQTRECKELRRLIAQWRRETRALLAQAALELAAQDTPDTLASIAPKIFTAPLQGTLE
jgi:hypothetical protein